jgi:hypothetical protein
VRAAAQVRPVTIRSILRLRPVSGLADRPPPADRSPASGAPAPEIAIVGDPGAARDG